MTGTMGIKLARIAIVGGGVRGVGIAVADRNRQPAPVAFGFRYAGDAVGNCRSAPAYATTLR